MGRNIYVQIVYGAKFLVWGETSMRRIAHGAKRPWGELPSGKKSISHVIQASSHYYSQEVHQHVKPVVTALSGIC